MFALGSLIAHAGSGVFPFGDGLEAVSLYLAVHEEPDLEDLPVSAESAAEPGPPRVGTPGPRSLADCLTGLDTRPTTGLPFTTLTEGSSFCVRSHGGQDVAVIRVLATDADDSPVQVVLTTYHQGTVR